MPSPDSYSNLFGVTMHKYNSIYKNAKRNLHSIVHKKSNTNN